MVAKQDKRMKAAITKIVTNNHTQFSGGERTWACVWNRKYFISFTGVYTVLQMYHREAPEMTAYCGVPSPLHFSSVALTTSPTESILLW